ncbi:hypothetical protein [uncultured Litoreibacter sp.]|uniref:hypothetical protein n=1 Tax=uncultured Litoreibacter sp. TaxID=1392394 RepID=UPI0026102365|nr:hypothetical protein [uncultured Litoreibacter sp.]
MRYFAFLASLLALAGIGIAGFEVQHVLQSEPVAANVSNSNPSRPAVEPQPPRSLESQRWPAVFGEIVVPEPQPPEPPAPPAPPPPQSPPVDALGYVLNGTVELDSGVWAIVSHPAGEKVLTVGDQLEEGATVVEIDAEGLWLETARGRELLGFGE